MPSRIRTARLRTEPLDARATPATLVSPTTLTYQDQDGDAVTVRFTHPVLSTLNVNNVFTFDTGTVNDNNGTRQQLQRIDLTQAQSSPVPVGLTVTAVRRADTGGDGFAAVGAVNAVGRDVGRVTIDGDLGQIDAGDATAVRPGLAALTAQSMGRYAATTQGPAPSLRSVVKGGVGSWTVRGDMAGATLAADFAATFFDGTIGAVTVGGALLGTAAAASGTGSIESTGPIGSVRIGGDVVGGTAPQSGFVWSQAGLVSVRIGGSIVGGAGPFTGQVLAYSKIGSVQVTGDLIGGSYKSSGSILSVVGIPGIEDQSIGSVRVGGSMRAGTGVQSASVIAEDSLGSLTVTGSLIGRSGNPVVISARGQHAPTGPADVAIKSIVVRGRVEFANLLAGVDFVGGASLIPVNADAQIGSVQVGGDWVASNLAAGVNPGGDAAFGTADDAAASGTGVTNDPARRSQIASVTVGGQVIGLLGTVDPGFGIVAQKVKAVKVGGTSFPLTDGVGLPRDVITIGLTADVFVREVA